MSGLAEVLDKKFFRSTDRLPLDSSFSAQGTSGDFHELLRENALSQESRNLPEYKTASSA
jgi:hypothetical protein